MEESSTSTKTRLVLKARTAFNSAASKAEKFLTDFKSDFQDSSEEQCRIKNCNSQAQFKGFSEPKQFRRKPPSIGKKQEWHERLRNIGRGRKGNEDLEKIESVKMFYYPIYDANLCTYSEKVASEAKGLEISDCYDASDRDIIPPASVFKQLTAAIESEKNYTSVKHFLTSSASSSPVRERASMGISAVKSLVLQEKAEKVASEFRDDQAWSFIQSILDTEGLTLGRKVGFSVENMPSTMTLPRDIRGAPPQSLIVKISEVMGSFKTLRKMALFWCRFIAELRRLWLKEEYIPGIPLDEIPDWSYCLLYQQLQLINCCLSRKKRRAVATDSLESLIKETDCDADGVPSSIERITSGSFPYAKTSNGNHVVRLGISHQSDNLTLLETGEPVYAPLAQEGPLLTEDLARETEEFVLRTGSVGAGCSQLLSDMQAFKAANPGCILEDFVRWHSPPDWTENESGSDSDASAGAGDSTSSRGRLSRRMKKEGNLWLELWETAKPVPAVRQAPLFDEDLAVEGALTVLEDISPSQLFGQLFQSLLGLGFVIAEEKLSSDENVTKLFYECKDFVVVSCHGDAWMEKIDDICQVYETVEAMFVRPDDVIKAVKQPEDACVTLEEPTSRFKKISQVFGGKNRSRKSSSEDNDCMENTANHRQSFATFFDSRASMFGKKPPKPANGKYQASHPSGLNENHWTVV